MTVAQLYAFSRRSGCSNVSAGRRPRETSSQKIHYLVKSLSNHIHIQRFTHHRYSHVGCRLLSSLSLKHLSLPQQWLGASILKWGTLLVNLCEHINCCGMFFNFPLFFPGVDLKNMCARQQLGTVEGGRCRWYWLYSLQHMGLSCPMCMYLPPLLSSNYAEQTKLSACCYKPTSVGFDCYSSDGCLQLIKTLSQSTCRKSPKNLLSI